MSRQIQIWVGKSQAITHFQGSNKSIFAPKVHQLRHETHKNSTKFFFQLWPLDLVETKQRPDDRRKKRWIFLKIYVVLRRIWPPRSKVCNFANFFPHFLFKCWGDFKKNSSKHTYLPMWLAQQLLPSTFQKSYTKLRAKLWFLMNFHF